MTCLMGSAKSPRLFGKISASLCLFTVLLLLPFTLSAYSLADVELSLEAQIQSLIELEQSLQQSDSELSSLRAQLQTLQAEIRTSETLSAEQAEQLTRLTSQLADLKESRGIWLKNYEGLLRLSRIYKERSEILGIVSISLGVGLVTAIVIAIVK
jgi:septal ring factor EnvC (AmiA/AmiB activator)